MTFSQSPSVGNNVLVSKLLQSTNENCAAVEEVCKFLCWLKRTFQLPLCQVFLAATSYKELLPQKEMGQDEFPKLVKCD